MKTQKQTNKSMKYCISHSCCLWFDIGALLREYDRNLFSDIFTIDQGVLEKRLNLGPR